jgi:putative NIF3 family GTP cyclohydrolase 1 type 2
MEMRTTVLHTEEAAEAILMVLVIMETLEAWVKEWAIKMAEAQAEAAEQAETGNMAQQAVAVAHLTQDKMVRIQHRQTELVVLDMLEDLVLDQEHLVVE